MTVRQWTIEITRTAEKQIKKLPQAAQESIIQFLRNRLQSAANPRQLGKPLGGEMKKLWRYRVGDYRLICDINDERLIVLLVRVGHRKDVYR